MSTNAVFDVFNDLFAYMDIIESDWVDLVESSIEVGDEVKVVEL